MNVLLFGPPGSGKGTQAKDVSTALAIPHIATGDIFRKHLKEGTELGKLARSYMDRGQLVPDSVTCDLVASRLVENDALKGVLLDGFPRSVPQAEWLMGWFAANGRGAVEVLNLMVPDALLVERIAGRRTCSGCGATYHAVYNPPPASGCASCGGEVIQRKDDAEDVVRARLATYHRETAPVLGVLAGAARVHDIDGVGAIDEIRSRIASALHLA